MCELKKKAMRGTVKTDRGQAQMTVKLGANSDSEPSEALLAWREPATVIH